MKIRAIPAHAQKPVEMPGARDAKIRMLIGPDDGARNFHMRQFEIAPGGCTPHHQHEYEHEIVVLAGRGTARTPEGDRPFQAGDVIFVPPDELHQFLNSGGEPCQFICLIPAPRQT